MASRAATTMASARRSAGVTSPRFATADSIASRTAAATARGVWLPPGPSKWAAPSERAGNWARKAATSYMAVILPPESSSPATASHTCR